MTRNIAVFAIAALFEIAGCFAFWAWPSRDVTPWVLPVGDGHDRPIAAQSADAETAAMAGRRRRV